jgi:hypothetical protein
MPLVSSLFSTVQIASERMDICKKCEKLSAIKTCKVCKCIMPIKVRLRHAECPIGKWKAIDDDGQMHYVDDATWEAQEHEIELLRPHPE